MEDNFMYSLRGEPPAEFARTLETQLERQAQDDAPFAAPRRITRVAALAASVAIVAFAFSFPAVRAAAQSFLDLFRVVNFAAVPVHFDRMQALRTQSLDLPHLIGDQIQVLKQPGHPTTYATPQAASAALHASVKLPSWIPVGWEISQVLVRPHVARARPGPGPSGPRDHASTPHGAGGARLVPVRVAGGGRGVEPAHP